METEKETGMETEDDSKMIYGWGNLWKIRKDIWRDCKTLVIKIRFRK